MDEFSPYSQSVDLAEALEQRGMPYELHGYEGLSRYFAAPADSVTGNWRTIAWQMFQDSLDCLRRALEGE